MGGSGPIKVYGWQGWQPSLPPKRNGTQQSREIMAAKSVAEVLRATGMSRHEFNTYASETGNEAELALALACPGVVFFQPLNSLPGEPWAVEQ